ncbi:small integral membrane protein 8 isoform X2 [Oryzias melastigma]|uniref:small integral membrane protein 8 isoform X2 n=1 Tax=Oryzias melastigma TaxID=30732 RepID=UPI000CF7E09D|nr:small integral membrane protein 8 isoform X2 [Oryzias melastigma]
MIYFQLQPNEVNSVDIFQHYGYRCLQPDENKPVMAFGLVAITLCVGYLGYMHATRENEQLYEAVDSQGERYMRRKTSKWD